MKHVKIGVVNVLALTLATTAAQAGWPGDPAKCKADAVKAGSVCMDKYEASVWAIPATKSGGQE